MLKRGLLILLLSLAGCGPNGAAFPVSTQAGPPLMATLELSQAMQREAEALALEAGIPIQQAMWRIGIMEASGALNSQLEENEADTFAGLWLVDQPDYRVVVAFTRDGQETLQPYIEGTILAATIEVREVALTQAELVAVEAKTHQLVEQLGLSLFAFTLVNIQKNRVEIHIPDRDLLQDRLVEAQLALPEHVAIVAGQATPVLGPPSNLTPAPGLHFPQLIAPTSLVYALSVSGKLGLQENCLRLIRDQDEPGDLLVWQPDHYLNDHAGVAEVLDRVGEVLARVGEVSCFSPVAGELSPQADGLLRSPLPAGCSGPYFLVGEVELAFQEDMARTMVEVSLVDLEVGSLYFIRKTPSLDAWVAEPAAFSGKLVWQTSSRCLRLQRDSQGGFQETLVIWPLDYIIRQEDGEIAILNSQGAVVAVLNEDVRLFGGLVVAEETIRATLNDELPCDCVGGDYWVVVRENP